MNKYILLPVAILITAGSSFGLFGGPAFIVPQSMTSMTVEATRANLDVSGMASAGGEESTFQSERVSLQARYGFAPYLDLGASIGTANLTMDEMSGGYSSFASSWSMSWGASLRAGMPLSSSNYQIVGSLNYMGFQPDGTTSNGMKSIGSKYMWHEVTPALTAGMRAGPVIPYAGLAKPFLFGEKDVSVSFNGQEFPAAGGSNTYSDSEQAFRGIIGCEWNLPDGYSVTGEGMFSTDGQWTLSIGLSQMMR